MKKSLIILFVTAVSVVFALNNCTKDNTTKVSSISGTVKYNGTSMASGAIVIVSSSPNATKVVSRVVADSAGNYSVAGLSDGKYYISAKYNTENTNLKSAGADVNFTTKGDTAISVSGSTAKLDLALTTNIATGQDVIEYAASGKWTLDQTHSRVGFSFAYDSLNAPFYGTFTWYGLNTFKFDQANPSNSSINAWIDVTSTETGAPTILDTINNKVVLGGRDGLNGCISHSFKVAPIAADTFFSVTNATTKAKTSYFKAMSILENTTTNGSLIASARATFVSTGVSVYGDGYLAVGNMTFIGVTKPVNLYFHYIKGYSKTTSGVTTLFSSFSGYFDFNPSKDYGMPRSSHVGFNAVDVNVSLQFKK
jgi:polyisoprenoid-binding protein YceI